MVEMDVANRVGLTDWVIGFYERGERLIRVGYLRRMRSIFETAGIEFTESDGGAGVRLKAKPNKRRSLRVSEAAQAASASATWNRPARGRSCLRVASPDTSAIPHS
jgi:hypothetical protein